MNWKIGIIGTGYWSEKHLQAWKRTSGVEIAALCDHNVDKRWARASAYNIARGATFSSLDEMLEQTDIDVVDIVTRPDTHFDLVSRAAHAGKHILCQKPFAPSYEEALEMVQVAKACGVRLMVTENWRWLERYQTAKAVLDSGRIGDIRTARYIHSSFSTPCMDPAAKLPQPYFREMPRLLFYEMGAHWCDTWRFLFGTPERLYAETSRISPHIEGEDAGIVTLGHGNFHGFMDMSWATREGLQLETTRGLRPGQGEQLIVDGTDGLLRMYANGRSILVSGDDHRSEELACAGTLGSEQNDAHFHLSQHFVDCLETGEPFQTSGEDNLLTLKMVFAIYHSAESHQPIFLNK